MHRHQTSAGPYRDIIQKRRPFSKRIPMDRAHRAKQFAPFAALKGFEESIEERNEHNKCEQNQV